MNDKREPIKGFEEYSLVGIQRLYLPVADWIAGRLIWSYIDPNVVTIAGIGFAYWASLRLEQGKWLIAIVLMLCAGLCDLLDGPMARQIELQGKHRSKFNTKVGEVIDPIADRACDIFLMLGFYGYVGMELGHDHATLVVYTIIAYLASSWLRTHMDKRGLRVIKGKPLTRTIFFAVFIVICILFLCDESNLKLGILLLLASTVLPLTYRVLGAIKAIWRACNSH